MGQVTDELVGLIAKQVQDHGIVCRGQAFTLHFGGLPTAIRKADSINAKV